MNLDKLGRPWFLIAGFVQLQVIRCLGVFCFCFPSSIIFGLVSFWSDSLLSMFEVLLESSVSLAGLAKEYHLSLHQCHGAMDAMGAWVCSCRAYGLLMTIDLY